MARHRSNQRGAQCGNGNAIRSGVYSFLATGSYPRGAGYVRRLIGQFRHSLEDTVLQRDGEVSLYDGAVIQSACRHEGRAQLLQRWLREVNADDSNGNNSIQDRLSILREIGNATDARDKCLKSLRLHEKPEEDDTWPTITVTNTPEAPECSEDAEAAPTHSDGSTSPDAPDAEPRDER